jgi:hypothetical protein
VIYDDTGGLATTEAIGVATVHNWAFPKEGGTGIIAFERGTGHVITDTADVTLFRIYKRWLGYHG